VTHLSPHVSHHSENLYHLSLTSTVLEALPSQSAASESASHVPGVVSE
ncbi:hypothetical protein Tco_0482942, partial [Tanacetum coccineum]